MPSAKSHNHPGQAFVELALGMFALALVLAALFSFTNYILSSLDMQRGLRAEAGRRALNAHGIDGAFESASDSDTVAVDTMAAEYIFGRNKVEIKESVHLPAMGLGDL